MIKKLISYFNKKEVLLMLFLLISSFINWHWINGIFTNTLLGIEEGYLDLAGIKSLSHSENILWYDLRTYGQPSEVTPYGRICVNIVPILLMHIVNNETVAFVLSWIILLFLSMFFMYLILSKILNIDTYISIAFSVLYVLSHPVLISGMAHGHMRYLMIIFLTPLYLFTLFKLLSFKKSYLKLFLSFCLFIESLLFIWTHAVIFGVLISLSFFIYIIIMKEKLSKIQFFKDILYVSIPTLLIGLIWLYIKIKYYDSYYDSPIFSIYSYSHTEMSNLISMLFLNWGMPNRDPLVWQSLSDITLNLIHSFPFFVSLLFLIYYRKKWLAWFIVFLTMQLSCGVYGPFFAIYNLYELPFRAPGRIFLPATYPFLIILGTIGVDCFIRDLKQKLKLKYKINNFVCIFLILFLIFSAYHTSVVAEYTYNLNPNLDDAYSKIPKYSRVLMLPVWGNVGSGISLSYGGTYRYQPYPTVGYSVMHLHEYLSAKHNLKDAFSPPSPWEVPSLTLWTFSDLFWKKLIKNCDFDGFYQHLRLLPNLQYIIVYKHILPSDIVDGLQNDEYVEKYYENEDLLVLKVKNQTNKEIMVSNGAFVIYDISKWKDGYLSLLKLTNLFNLTHPIVFDGFTPWYEIDPEKINWNKTIIFINSNNKEILEKMASNFIKTTNNKKIVNGITFQNKKTSITIIGEPKYILISDKILELEIDGKKYSAEKIRKLGDSLYLYEIHTNFSKKINTINLITKEQERKYMWVSNFDPSEISKIKTYYINTPINYRSDYEFNTPIEGGYILLMKSYWPKFECSSDNKQKYKSFVANIMLNGFHFNKSGKFRIHFKLI